MEIIGKCLVVMALMLTISISSVAQNRASTASEVVKQKVYDETHSRQSESLTERRKARFSRRKAPDANIQWRQVVYRELPVDNPQNEALNHYEKDNGDTGSLLGLICTLLANGEINAYEFSDARPILTDEYKVSPKEIFNKFHIGFPETADKAVKKSIELFEQQLNDLETECYYVEERHEFNVVSGRKISYVSAICPVMKMYTDIRNDRARYPMCWIKMEELKPYLLECMVAGGGGNMARTHTLDSFFSMKLYSGEIYRTGNNKTLYELFPDETARTIARDSIERRLSGFNSNIHFEQKDSIVVRNKNSMKRTKVRYNRSVK